MTEEHSTDETQQDVADNYLDYLNAALGYQWDVWETTDPITRLIHDRILEGGTSLLTQDELSVAKSAPNDLIHLAFARYHQANGATHDAVTELASIIDPPRECPGIAYGEVYERLARILLSLVETANDEERNLLETYSANVFYGDANGAAASGRAEDSWASRRPYYRAFYDYLNGGEFGATVAPLLEGTQSYERRFEAIEDLYYYGKADVATPALVLLEEELSAAVPQHPLLVDIRVALSRGGMAS